MLKCFFLMIVISTSLTVPTQPLPRFHVEAWLPFRNCEMDYLKRTRHIHLRTRAELHTYLLKTKKKSKSNTFRVLPRHSVLSKD